MDYEVQDTFCKKKVEELCGIGTYCVSVKQYTKFFMDTLMILKVYTYCTWNFDKISDKFESKIWLLKLKNLYRLSSRTYKGFFKKLADTTVFSNFENWKTIVYMRKIKPNNILNDSSKT